MANTANKNNITSNHLDLITFHQINLQHSKLATHELVKQLEGLARFIVLAQEPYFYNKLQYIPRQIKTFSHTKSKPRSCIMHHSDLKIFPLHQFSDQDTTVGAWEPGTLNIETVFLISSYWDINHDQIPTKLIETIQYCLDNNIPYICGIDSNAWSTMWGSLEDNPRGETLEEWLIGIGAVILNRGSAPTFRTSRASSTIDISFSSSSVQHLCTDWRIHNEPSLSDHVAIRFNISCQPPPGKWERNFRKVDWTLFASLLEEWPTPPASWNGDTIESNCDILNAKN